MKTLRRYNGVDLVVHVYLFET